MFTNNDNLNLQDQVLNLFSVFFFPFLLCAIFFHDVSISKMDNSSGSCPFEGPLFSSSNWLEIVFSIRKQLVRKIRYFRNKLSRRVLYSRDMSSLWLFSLFGHFVQCEVSILVPQPGSNPHPLQCKGRVLTTREVFADYLVILDGLKTKGSQVITTMISSDFQICNTGICLSSVPKWKRFN